MNNLEKVNDYLTEAKTFYFTTVDGDKPKCRPLGFHMIYDNKIYFGVGTFKEVYKQMIENQNIEICACTGPDFLRYYGKAVFDSNPKISEMVLDTIPNLKRIYNEETGYKLGMFFLENATAEFRSMMGITEKIDF